MQGLQSAHCGHLEGAGYNLPPRTTDGNHLRCLVKQLKTMLKIMHEWREESRNDDSGYPKTGVNMLARDGAVVTTALHPSCPVYRVNNFSAGGQCSRNLRISSDASRELYNLFEEGYWYYFLRDKEDRALKTKVIDLPFLASGTLE